MKTRNEIYQGEGAQLLRFITTYHSLQYEQVLRLFSKNRESIKSLITSLVKQKRIIYDKENGLLFDSQESANNPDYGMIASFGCEIDFIIKGLDTKSRSIVASRKDAMLKKRQIFYFDQDSSGQTKIHEDRIVQARVIAVAEKVVRAEIFGVETSILARDLSFDWLGDARERFQVGEHILVRILTIQGDSPETLSIHADVKSVEGNTSKENLKNCRVQGKYAGTVEDIHKGTVFVRLELGVNAIAHSCYDSRTVGKKDKVSFVVTHIDEERNVAVGIITRIIKQNI